MGDLPGAVSKVASWLSAEGEFGILPSQAHPRMLAPLHPKSAAHASINLFNGHWTWKGRLKRGLFHLAVSMGTRVYGHDRVSSSKNSDCRFERLVREVTGEPRPIFAALLRSKVNRSQLSNLIVQAMRPDGRILGFLKVPLTPETTGFTHDEARNLRRLSAVPEIQASIPEILYAGEWDGSYVLFLSPLLGKPVASLTAAHLRFLRRLWQIDAHTVGASRMTKELAVLFDQTAAHMDAEAGNHIARALRWIEESLGDAPVEYGFSHGEFAPSHTMMNNGNLFVLDWEYAGSHRPIAWDGFNFAVNAATGKGTEVDLGYLGEPRRADVEALYLAYLVDIAIALVRGLAANGQEANLKCEPYEGLISKFLRDKGAA